MMQACNLQFFPVASVFSCLIKSDYVLLCIIIPYSLVCIHDQLIKYI